jgi:tRNA(fMet)-specific endonuclease VapC
LLNKQSALPRQKQFISTITITEIVYGARKSNRAEFHLTNLEKILLPAVNIAVFDSKAAYVFGRLRAELEKKGTPFDLADLEIAAITISRDFTLVTGNTRHFDRIEELRLENWLI